MTNPTDGAPLPGGIPQTGPAPQTWQPGPPAAAPTPGQAPPPPPPFGAGAPAPQTSPYAQAPAAPSPAAPYPAAPRVDGAPGLGQLALGLGIGALALGLGSSVLFFLMTQNIMALSGSDLMRGLTFLVAVAGITVGIIAVKTRRGRRPATLGIVLSVIGLAVPFLAQAAYMIFILFAMAPIVFS